MSKVKRLYYRIKYQPKKVERRLDDILTAAIALEVQAKQSERVAERERKACYKKVAAGDMEGAKIAAENSVREKRNVLTFRRTAARTKALHQRIAMAVQMQQVSGGMSRIVKHMAYFAKLNDIDKMGETLNRFEAQVEDVECEQKYLDNMMGAANTTAEANDDVKSMLQEACDVAALDARERMRSVDAKKEEETICHDISMLSVPQE